MMREGASIDHNAFASAPVSALSHLALWPALYIAAAVACLAQLAGVDALATDRRKAAAAGFALLTAAAVYLLDRVKLRDAWLDPADAAAHPRRFAFVARHARVLRVAIAVLLLAASVLGAEFMPFGWLVPVLAAAGVHLYAGRPRTTRARPKDVIIFKNALVATGITGFAAIVAIAAGSTSATLGAMKGAAVAHWAPLALACLYLASRVFADAVLCDLDDEAADRRFGTATLPVLLGRIPALNAAMSLRIGASFAIVPITLLPLHARLAWAGVTVITTVSTRVARPGRLRDWVDARFALEALVVTTALALLRP